MLRSGSFADRRGSATSGSLDLWLLPKLGHLDLTQVTTDRIAAMIAEMEAAGLSASSVLNHLKPLSGTLKRAMRKGLIARDPIALLTSDERPRLERREMRILEPAEIEALLAASSRLAARMTAKYDYTLLPPHRGLHRTAPRGTPRPPVAGCRPRQPGSCTSDGRSHRAARSPSRRPRRRGGESCSHPASPGNSPNTGKQPLARGHARPDSFVFASNAGTALSARNVTRRGFHAAVREAKLSRPDRASVAIP